MQYYKIDLKIAIKKKILDPYSNQFDATKKSLSSIQVLSQYSGRDFETSDGCSPGTANKETRSQL